MGYSPIAEIMHSLSGHLPSFEEMVLEGVVITIGEKAPDLTHWELPGTRR